MAKQRKEPSQKQKDYAANIARVLNIKLPEENTSAAYRDFISENQERFAQSRPVAVHFTDEQINRANLVNIVDYASSMGLELKRDGKEYRVKDYSGGFIISPEKNNWNWFGGHQGGGVVQLCMFLENKTWQEAVGTLLNEDMEPIRRAPDWKPKEEPPKEFNLPPKNNTDKHVYAYLTKTRGIDAEIVKDMLDKGYIYENQHRSCVFVGKDNEGVPRHASVRSTNTVGKAYKKDVSGSQKKYSFSISGTSGNLHVFEAPIDALSYMSLQKLQGKPVNDSYVALGGVTDKALEQYLEDHKDIRQITVCTDGDEAGEKAAGRINEKYGTDYEIVRERSLHKDFNEDLVDIMQEENFKRNLHEVVAGKSRVSDSILIGKTPNILVACGAAEGVDFTISKTVIDKCTRPEIRDADGKLMGKTGHGLTEEQLYSALMNVKEPVMVLKGNRENSLIVVTEYPDDKNRPIVVSVLMDKKSGRTMINGVSSVYGRDKFEEYLERQIQADNILAFDNKKAEPLLQPIGKWYPKRGEVFSYDSTIAYSMESVKKNDKIVQIPEEGKKEDERLENQINRDIDEIKRDGMAAVHQNKDARSFVDKQIEQIMKKLDAFAKTADDYEMFADEEFQERLYRTLQEYKKLLQDNPDGIVTLQPKFYEQSNPNELDINHPNLWNEFWSYLERYGVTGDEKFSNRLNNIAAQSETKEQAFSIMKDIKQYLDNRLYMTSYMRGDVAVNEDIASYYLENAYSYLNQEVDNPDRNQEMENQIKAVQEVFSLDEAATGRFYTTNLGGTGWGMGETPYFYITEDLQSSFEAAYASYMASDEDGKTIGYSNVGMSTAQIVMLAGCYYDEGKEVHVLNKHLENQVFDKDSKVLADIEKRLYEELKQRNAETMAVQIEDFNSEVSNSALLQSERLPVAIESTADYVDPKVGFTAVATGDMPAGTKYRIVTYGENGRLVPYQENSAIYSDRTEAEAYLEEHKDRLESIDYDDIVYQAGEKIADYNLKQRQRIEEGLHSFQFDEDGYLHFSITVNGYDYDGLYRVYAPADGKNRELVSIDNGQGEPFFEENWELIRQHLEQYVNAHPEIGPDGEEIAREKASVYCEWSEHDAFEEGKVYSVFEFDRLMEQADTEWIELRQQEREQYGENAFEELYKHNLPQHQTYAKTKYTVFVPGMTELTLRQDIGDGLGSMIDFVRTTTHKHYAVPLENAFLDGLQQELDNRTMIEEQAIKLQSEMRYEEANALLKTLEKGSEIVSELPEKPFAQQVDEVLAGNSNRYSDLKVCDTPDILLKAGCEPLPMFYTKKHLRDALRPKGNKGAAVHHHGLDVEQIKAIPELLRNPVMIYDSLSRNDSIVVVTSEVDADNSPIVVIVRPNGEARYEMELVSSNFVLSVHGRDNFSSQLVNAIEQNKVLYCDKQKSQELFSVLGLQLPQGFNNFDFDKIIHQSENIVKAAKQVEPSNEDKDLSEKLPEYPARPEKKAYHNDEEWRQAVETYKRDNQRFNEAIEQLAKEHTQNKSRFSSNEEFAQWLSQNGYTEDMIKGIDLKAASDFVTAYEQVLKAIPEIKGNLFSSVSLERPSKKNAVAWVSGDKALHLSDRLFKPGVYSEVIKSELFHTAQGYYSKAADPFLHVYIHEMGHSVESTIAEKIGGKEKLWSELGNLFNVKVDIGEDLPYISGYGNEHYSDWFAEMFSAYVNGNMEEDVLKFGEFIQGCLKGELGHVINKHKMNVINDTDQTFVLTGAKVSLQMQDILECLASGNEVSVEEINNTKEIRYCRSIADNGEETYLLDGREDKQKQVLQYMESVGSASGRFDENGKMLYDGEVRRDSRLDIVIGLIGAGKSSTLTDVISQEFHSKVIDNDMAKAQFIEYQDGLGAKLVHKESQEICERVLDNALERHENIVLPKVGSDANKLFDNIITSAKEHGYEINVHFVDLERDKALGRVLNRLISDGRYMDPALIYKYCPDKSYNRCERTYETLKQNELISGYSRWDNDVAKGEKPFMVESHNLTGEYIDNARLKENEKGVADNGRIGLQNNGERRQGLSADLGENGGTAEAFVRGVYEGSGKDNEGRGRELQGGVIEELEPTEQKPNDISLNDNASEKLIKLQGVYGHHKGTPAKELKIGDVLVWNYGETSEVVGMKPSKTGKTIVFQMKSTQDGEVRDRRMNAETLVVVQDKNPEADNNLQSELDISISNYESSEPNEVKFDVNIGEEEVHKGEAGFDDDGTVNWIFVDPVPADAGEEGKEQLDTAKALKEDWDKIVSRVKELLQDLRYKSKEFMRTIGVGNARRMYTQGTQPGASSGYSNMNRNQQSETQKASQNKNSSEQEKADNGNTKEEKTEAADRSNKNPVNDTEQYKQLIESHKQLISGSKTKRRPLVINAFGGPGSGKSTSCLDICQQLKKLNYKAEYVSEYAKDLVYDKNEKLLDGSPESQFEILKEQLKRVDRLYNSGEVDFIVTDSPVLLNEIYNKSLTEEYDSMVTSLHNDFDNFAYFMERDASAFQKEGRIHNLEESQKIDQDIKQLLEDKKVRYETYNHDAVDNIVSDAVRTFNRINGIEEAATEKQKAFAEKIAQTLNITLPEKATKAEYAAFINENNNAFLNSNAPLREQGANTGSYQDYLEMVTKDGNRLSEVPKEHYTDELLLAAVRNWGAAVRQIPEDRITAEIAMASVQQYGQNLKNVPEKLKSEEVCIAAYISSSGKSIRYTPRDMKDRVKEEGQKRLAESNSAVPNSKRQIDKEQIQQKGQEWASRIENLLKEHETDPDAMVEDIAFAGKFYQYSTRNIQLMRQQNPGITYVAKASLFNEMGYHIKDGEQAMIGRVPQFNRYIINEKGERVYSEKYTPEIKQKLKEGTLKEEQAIKKFDFVAAFYDISQTDCPAEDYPSVFHMGIPSELHQDAFDAMKKFAEENLGFKVMVTDLKSINLRGSCEPDNKIIRINDRLEATMALSTLCHEIAHGIIHTSENSAKMSAAQKECEADVMDIMLEASLGLAINESRRDHLFENFQAYKKEQAAKEQPYEVTLEKITDRVQSKVFRTYIDDINICLDKYLPAEGSQNEKAAEEVVKNLAKLDYAYNMNHEALIDGKKPLFDSRRLEDYQELYRKEKDSFQLQGSFMPKLAVCRRTDDGTDYLPGGVELHEVQLLSDYTVNKILKHPEQIKPGEQPHVPVGSIVILKENILSEPHIYLVTKSEGFREITEDMKGMYEQVKNRIDCDFYVRNEYLCIHDLLGNGIELEPQLMEKYNHICKEYGYSKNPVPDSGIQLMARINLMTENLPQSSKDMVMEYVFRTGNFEKAERYAERIVKEPDAVRQLRQEMKLVDSYKYMLRTIAEYENNNDISEKNRLTTGAYNTSAIPVLSENVSSLSQINQKFLLIRKYASPDSVKYYSIVKDEGMEERYRIAYVELNEYEPEVVYSTAAFENYEEAEKFYDQYLHTANSRLVDSSQADKLAELENRGNQIALSEITSIGKTIAAEKQSYMETGLDEEGALEMLRMEIRDGYPQIKPADAGGVQQELETLKNFKKIVNSYGRERFIELSNMENLKETNVSARLWRQLAEQADALDKMNITGIDDVKQCVAAALDSSVTASDLEQALNAIDSAVLSAEFSNLETEFEGFEEYNYALDTLKAAQVTPDKFCYVDFGTEPGPYLYTSDISGNIYRKSLSSEWDGSVGDLNTRLKKAGYEICSSLDDFRAYAANNRLGIFNVPEKEKNEAFIRILESTNDRLPRGQVLSVYDFKDTIDKLSAAGEFQDNITYSLVTRKDQEINSYIDTYSGNSEKNVYEQLYDKAQEKVPELSRVISRQYYQDQINSNERHLVRPLLQQMKRENKSVEDSEELGSAMDSNARLEEIIKELDLSPADAELLKLNAGNIRTEQSADIQAQQQMNQKTQQKKLRSQQQEGMSM